MRLLALLMMLPSPAWVAGAATKTQARLILSADAARAGETVMAGVLLKMPKGWHTYWRNAGDSGAPTEISWQLPEGIKAGEIQWPVPEKLTVADLTTYVYHEEVLLMVPLTFADNAPIGPKALKAQVSWLECERLCLPGKAEITAALEVGPNSRPSADAPLFAAWKKRLPQRNDGTTASAWWEKEADGESRPLILEVSGKEADDFFPYANKSFEVQAPTDKLPPDNGRIRFRKLVKKFEGEWPAQLQGIVVGKPGLDIFAAEVNTLITVGSQASGIASSGTRQPGDAEESSTYRPLQRSLPLMLWFAFLGGLILNIMPCVLPVIALKVLGFVKQSKESPARVREHGLLYGLGVLVSFLVLAGIVIAVQHAGRAASWGMQFQNPQFLVAMTVLVTLVALNLFGLFEVTLSGRAMGAAAELASKEGKAGAFFNGVLATALATPCTAPYLGFALGFAFAQSGPVVVLMFLMIGLGLAAPYVLLSFVPGLARFLPRPGAWMEKFKIAMGFPMLATAIWLFTLTTAHFGKSAPFWLGFFLVLLALSVWIWGEFVQRGVKRRALATGLSLGFAALAYFGVLESQLHWRSPVVEKNPGNALAHEPGGIDWKPWSPEAVAKARAEGRPVFVDFTADWCVTCQANKRTSIEISSVRAKLKELNAVALIGDYTLEDDAITAELKRFGRAGVPLVLVYPADPKAEPNVLPEVLTPKIVLDAIEKAAPKGASGKTRSAVLSDGETANTAIDWRPWSNEAVANARAAGKPLLVDFTANWCPNCKVIENLVLESAPVRAKLREIDAVTLRADWSKRDESIARELERFNQYALPFIVVYPKNRARAPLTFEVLTADVAVKALNSAAGLQNLVPDNR
jgi:thiol:disulfide interchange protein/DsbC/DsbD-like thiol-disulfide interchange protein